MASNRLNELHYRKFDDLLNEVYIDLPSFTREGMVEPGQLIKIAQKCNYELGLKIYQTKETILDITHGRTKLPSDFHMLNYAILLQHYRICEPGAFNGLHTEDVATPIPPPPGPKVTNCPCWTVIAQGAQCKVTYCDGTIAGVYFPPNDDGSPKTTKLCATDVDWRHAGGGPITAFTDTFCYDYPGRGFSCDTPELCCKPEEPASTCGTVLHDPFYQNRVYTTCNNQMQVNVIEYRSDEVREYSTFEQIHMVPSKEASSFCVNTSFRNARHTGNIKDGFIWVPTMRQHGNGHGRMYICYLGAMEDAEGNLLVLDHPKINDYYEWALKERILQNQYLNGEPDLLQRWQMASQELKKARAEALSITTMPDFFELKRVIETNRKAMYAKYLHPFSSLYANTPGWPWSLNNDPV